MLTRRVGVFRPVARAGAIVSIAMIGMLLSANAAFAATTVIGSAAADTRDCSTGYDTVQLSWTTPGTVSYEVPAGGGNIISWSTQAGPSGGQVGLQVWRALNTVPQSYLLVGASPLVTPLTPLALNDIPLVTPIPVNAGDLIGLRVEGLAYCNFTTGSPSDVYGSMLRSNTAVGAIDTFGNNKWQQLDVAATVEAVVTPPPPPPPTGCDSTNTSSDGSGDNSATSPADTSAAVTADASTGAPADTSNVDSTDKSAKDATDKSKKDKSAKEKSDQSTGGDNCQQ